MEDQKSGRRSRTLSFGLLQAAKLRRKSENSTTATRAAEDDSNIKKLQEMLQQSLRREADTLRKLRHLSEMYQELLYRSHSPSSEAKGRCADSKYICFSAASLLLFFVGRIRPHAWWKSLSCVDSLDPLCSPPDASTTINVSEIPLHGRASTRFQYSSPCYCNAFVSARWKVCVCHPLNW